MPGPTVPPVPPGDKIHRSQHVPCPWRPFLPRGENPGCETYCLRALTHSTGVTRPWRPSPCPWEAQVPNPSLPPAGPGV